MASFPLVSVVMIVKNGEKHLARAMESVTAQDYRPLEILVVDGQSADRTVEIARSFPRVRVLHQKGVGVSDAYNLGIEHARGEFIAFLSHDDLWTPDKLSVQVNAMISRPETRYSVAKARFILEPGCSRPPGFRPELIGAERMAWIMETLVARREAFDAVGAFDNAYKTAEDVDWFARARDAGVPFVAVDQVLLEKRIHDRNISLNARENTSRLLHVLKRKIDRGGQPEKKEGSRT
ncbi:MAG: glycosyltransferase [Desulfobacterales bacterium]|nr:glycosyltransferase [Desulfobacterales bacterium]